MATWTQFTSFLDGTRSIRKVERDEIYDNLAALLSASDCATAGYSLDATELTAVKGSGMITDRARLNGPASSVTRDRLQTLFATASSAFDNYSAAVTTALAGEGISSTQRDAYISGNVESWKLWNYYKRLIDALTCSPSCPEWFVQYRSKSASKTKCGHNELGTPSSPPKVYLLKIGSGVVHHYQQTTGVCGDPCTFQEEWSWAGHCEYTRPGCGAPSNAMSRSYVGDANSDCILDTFPPAEEVSCTAEEAPEAPFAIGRSVSSSTTVHQFLYDGICRDGDTFSGDATITLDSEYTTALLQTDCADALSAAGWSAYGGIGVTAFWSLTSDERTASRRHVQAVVVLESASPGGCRVTWKVRHYGSGVIISSNCAVLSAGMSDYELPALEAALGEELTYTDITVELGGC